MIPAATTTATHEPSQVTTFMAELSATVRESTTRRVMCWSKCVIAAEWITTTPTARRSPVSPAQIPASTAMRGSAALSWGGPALGMPTICGMLDLAGKCGVLHGIKRSRQRRFRLRSQGVPTTFVMRACR